MTFLNIKNRAISTLSADIADDASFLTVDDGSRFPASNFHITIEDEIILCSSRTGNVMTIERAKESTFAVAHVAGEDVELRITAALIKELQDKLDEAYRLEPLSDQCDGENKAFNIDFDIGKIIWISLGGGLLISGLDFNKTGAKEITLAGKYDTSPPELGEEFYIHYIKL